MDFEDKTKSDEEILSLSIDRPSLFEIIVNRYQNAFLRKAKDIIHDDELARDIVQESFMKIYMSASRFREVEEGSFKAWAYRIILNTSFSFYRKRQKERIWFVDEEVEFYENIADETDYVKRNELEDFIISVFSKMPKSLSRILSLYYIEDRPQKEIAKIEGVSLQTVKTRVYRAKKELKRVCADVV
ncbi:MAG: RNA polymerase sigma factor [Parcubacteria group bacterium]|nr:RNA polymerase sigma factor [Parcubacteria group bacterium]MCR4342489.1 RNA polymerase sigma factor [Patescibacteria group bacterium]